jgi:hypothetical protein
VKEHVYVVKARLNGKKKSEYVASFLSRNLAVKLFSEIDQTDITADELNAKIRELRRADKVNFQQPDVYKELMKKIGKQYRRSKTAPVNESAMREEADNIVELMMSYEIEGESIWDICVDIVSSMNKSHPKQKILQDHGLKIMNWDCLAVANKSGEVYKMVGADNYSMILRYSRFLRKINHTVSINGVSTRCTTLGGIFDEVSDE